MFTDQTGNSMESLDVNALAGFATPAPPPSPSLKPLDILVDGKSIVRDADKLLKVGIGIITMFSPDGGIVIKVRCMSCGNEGWTVLAHGSYVHGKPCGHCNGQLTEA